MSRTGSSLIRPMITVFLGLILVAMPLPIGVMVVFVWPFLVLVWVIREARAGSWRAGVAELTLQFGLMSFLVAAAIWAPCKYEDEYKAKRIALPKQALSIKEITSNDDIPASCPFRYWVHLPDDIPNLTIRFPSRDLTIGEFIAAIEAQTPLRHSFSSCGNGSTILWGGDCGFGVEFSLPTP